MKKTIIITTAFLSLFLFTAIGYSQEEITNREWNIFFAAMEKWWNMPYYDDFDEEEEAWYRMFREVGSSYGITSEEAEEIVCYVAWEGHFWDDEDEEILDELYRRLDAMPDYYTWEDEKRIYEDLASQYEITYTKLRGLEFADDLTIWWCW